MEPPADGGRAIDAESLARMQDKAPFGSGGGGGSLFDDPDEAPAQLSGQFPARRKSATANAAWAEPRRDRPEAGWWSGSVITDESGKATVAIPMPETTTRWAMIARGVSVETLVGEATASVVTKDQFFLEIKSPRAALEGDKIRFLARVHDLTGYAGLVDLEMTLKSGDRTFAKNSRTIMLKAREVGEVLFDTIEIPAVGELDIIIRAATRQNDADAQMLTDSLVKTIAVQPFGIQYAAHGGGVATDSSRLLLTLPEDLAYNSQWMTVTVGPNLHQQIIDMALGTGLPDKGKTSHVPAAPRHYGRLHASELLAALAGLEYARATNALEADHARLTERARTLISALIVSQHGDGGWSWKGSSRADFAVTSMAYWALSDATRLGFTVSDATLTKARALLNQYYQRAASADHEQRAIVLHALSVSGDADFKLANTLYRERNGLTPIAIAYAAMTLANLDRDDMAVEVLNVLDNRASESVAGGRQLVSWHEDSRYHPWLSDRIETTAVALLALMKAHPTSRRIEPAAQYLLQQYGCFGFPNGRSRGPGIAALAMYFRAGQFANTDFQLVVSVNGTEIETIAADGETPRVVLNIDPALLRNGRNEIDFSYRGRGRYAYAATMRGFSDQFKDTHNRGPYVRRRNYYHAPLEYRGVALSAASTSPVRNLEVGQRTRVHVNVSSASHVGYLIIEEPIPAGTTLVPGSFTKYNALNHEVRDGKIIMYIPPGEPLRNYSYELVGYTTGEYRALPTVIRDAFDPSQMRVHQPAEVNVLPPGERSDDPYQINDAERYALGKAYFDDGLYGESLAYLWPLFDRERKYQERDVARMLLWAHTAEAHFNAERVVSAFELLSVRHPDLNIPFDRILRVGEAYRYIGEYERAWLVFRATIESSFRNDSMISAVLEDEGQMLSSFAFQQNLWWEYPDIADVASSYFALAQTIYDESPNAHNLKPSTITMRTAEAREPDAADGDPADAAPTRISMLVSAIEMLDTFLSLYPENPLRDDAAFSMTSAFLDLKDYESVVQLSKRYAEKFADSTFGTSFQYMEALGWFWQRAYQPAIDSATVVATGDSRDRDFARYMLGQIYHAQGKPAEAIDWYEDVRTQYADAAQAIEHFQHKSLTLPEVSLFKPGEDVAIALEYRNIADASLQVYKVDLMKLYLREKNLSNITEVNLAGISPQHLESFSLGDGKDYQDRMRTAQLELNDEGAYLVICRGDDLFASGLVLITPLEIDVDEDPVSGRVRVNVVDAVDSLRPADVHVKVVGSENAAFESGDTDLRGIFVADGIQGTVTAIARDADARYAFYRGETWLGPQVQSGRERNNIDVRVNDIDVDYKGNLRQQQLELQRSNRANFDAYRRAGEKGVEVQKAR